MTIACSAWELRATSCIACERPGTSAWRRATRRACGGRRARPSGASAGRDAPRRRARCSSRASGGVRRTCPGPRPRSSVGVDALAARGSSTVASATSGTACGCGLDDRGLVVGREPDLDRAAREVVDGALGRLRGDDLAVVGERGRASCTRAPTASGRPRASVTVTWRTGLPSTTTGRISGSSGSSGGGASVGSRTSVCRRSTRGFSSSRSTPSTSIASNASESASRHSSRTSTAAALEPAAPLAQQLEDVLHRVRERCDALEAHRRAHALQGVRDPEDLADRLVVVGRLLDADDGEVQLLEVLAALREEHRQVLVEIHHAFR